MSYTPNEWQRGDVVTSEKLNHMEQGIAESGGGWDAGIEFDVIPDPEHPTAHFIFGSRDALMEKVNVGILPMIFFKTDRTLIGFYYTVEKDLDDPEVLYISYDNLFFIINADGSIDVSL